ncbi:MAG: MFS transporter [Salinivirgaceae bacterium]|jgi:MFS family permease|nr:MFS transporter [Salinivirgaceae bacterium]
MINLKRLKLGSSENKTFKLHTAHMFLEGIIDGALLLTEFILIKSLFATNYQVSFLFQFSVIVLLFSVLFNQIIKRLKRKKRFLLWVALITRLPLAGLVLFPSNAEIVMHNKIYPLVFLFVFLFYYLYKPAILPTINLLLRNSYKSDNFGKLYSYSTSVKKIVVLFVTFGFGLLLDFDNYAFTYVFPVLSVLGILSIYLLTLIDYSAPPALNNEAFWFSIKKVYHKMGDIIIRNKPFRDFEISFMFYGFAWMATAAVITIFLERSLHLNYFSISFYKNAYNLVAIVLLPYFGKLIGKIDPRKYGILTFVSMLLHLLFMLLTSYFTISIEFMGIRFYLMLVISYIFYGIFTASMALLWGIGSSYFCTNEDAGDYQSVHLSFVGFRSVFAPIIGIYFLGLVGYTAIFTIGIVSLIIAILLMFYSRKRYSL